MIVTPLRGLSPRPLSAGARTARTSFAAVARSPIAFGLGCVLALLLVLASERAYRQSMTDLAGMLAPSAIGAALVAGDLDELERTLLLGRIGVIGLATVSLLAWATYLGQATRLRGQQASQRRVGAECDRLEFEVDRQTTQLVALTQHLQTVREDERGRLARDLHDELGALLTAAKLDAARLRSRLAGSAPEALPVLAHLVAMLDGGIALKRDVVEALRPSALDALGLVDALEILVRDFAARSGVAVHHAFEKVALTPTAELMVYRLVQEAITNITKYAEASQVWLALSARDDRVEVSVRDDGVGFDTAAPLRSAFGLAGMRYRVEAEQGTMIVESAPGQGTLIRASLPRLITEASPSGR